MRRKTKVLLALLALLAVICCVPVVSNAAEVTVDSESALRDAIAAANPGDVIVLSDDIETTSTIVVDKEIIIDGKGYDIIGTWDGGSGDQSLITVTGELTLTNITLKDAPKYGVQAYEGGKVIFNGTRIENCGFGGVLINGGIAEVKSLDVGKNGATGNNQIEIDQGTNVTKVPTLIMNGQIYKDPEVSDEIINLASNGKLTEYSIENDENSIYKAYATETGVVIAGYNNRVLFTSNESAATVNTTENEKVIVRLYALDSSIDIAVDKGSKITSDLVEESLTTAGLLSDEYTLEGVYSNETLTNLYDYEQAMDQDTSLYVKLAEADNSTEAGETEEPDTTVEDEKDDTPKTGAKNFVGIAVVVIALGTVAIVALKRKNA